jgi:hypothetical protein
MEIPDEIGDSLFQSTALLHDQSQNYFLLKVAITSILR